MASLRRLDAPPQGPPLRYRRLLREDSYEDVEQFYVPGGYFPVDIGDTFGPFKNGTTYTILYKLGWTDSCSSWLARRRTAQPAENERTHYVLKIFVSDPKDTKGENEASVLFHLNQRPGGWEVPIGGHPNIVQLLDSFALAGPNGVHRCLVFPFLGPTLSLDDGMAANHLTAETRHRICQQLADAVAYLDAHGICHGNLAPHNVALEIPVSHPILRDENIHKLFQNGAHNHGEDLVEADGSLPKHGPRKVVASALNWYGLDRELIRSCLTSVRIINFEHAFSARDPPAQLPCDLELTPPELLFGYPPARPSDIWQLGLLFFHIHALRSPFRRHLEYNGVAFELLLWLVASYFGPAPAHWKGRFRWDEYGKRGKGGQFTLTVVERSWFSEEFIGVWAEEARDDTRPSLDEELKEDARHLTAEQRAVLVPILTQMLAWEPDKRIPAYDVGECLKHPVLSAGAAD